MSTLFPNGGPVHPVRLPIPYAIHAPDTPQPTELHTGMSLRDHFAGLAMQAFLNGHVSHYGHENPWPYDAMASEAYDVADAMLRAREKEPSS